jgi:hypothetical protein
MADRKQRKQQEWVRKISTLQKQAPVTYFLQLGPVFHHLPMMPANYEPTNGLVH